MNITKVKSELQTVFTNLQYAIRERQIEKAQNLQSRYSTMRVFCMDCEILSFMDLERLEYDCFNRINKCDQLNQESKKNA